MHGLDSFSKILPKKIQIDVGNYDLPYNVLFIEQLLALGIFDNSITTFEEIYVKHSARNFRILSRIAKNVNIILKNDDKDEFEIEIFDAKNKSLTDKLTISDSKNLKSLYLAKLFNNIKILDIDNSYSKI